MSDAEKAAQYGKPITKADIAMRQSVQTLKPSPSSRLAVNRKTPTINPPVPDAFCHPDFMHLADMGNWVIRQINGVMANSH
ncbi:hypothetical protein [Azotobacter chroococcum]|uniref:hypothetical protein n=1 Tax=Azotobacter chroococcum TaxID=353 RepID=UPI0011846B17|nr:hypothetical protein [Azotobacter chroococcum]